MLQEFESLSKRQKVGGETSLVCLDSFIEFANDVKTNIERNPHIASELLESTRQKLKLMTAQLADNQKEMMSSVTKFIKWTEKQKQFKADAFETWDPDAMNENHKLLDLAIAQHFIREGQFEIAAVFEQEAKVTPSIEMKEQFSEMYHIIQEIKEGNLVPAISWCEESKVHLDKIGSSLHFSLHKTRFLSLVSQSQIKEALLYAKANFNKYGRKYSTGTN